MRTKASFLFIISFFLLAATSSIAQDYDITKLTTDDGLPTNHIYNVFKDSKNFMWFCTEAGVVRYNGIGMEVFTMKDGLADNDIFHCIEDKWGRIWFASYNGQLSFFKNDKFYNANNCDFIPTVDKSSGFIRTFFISKKDSSLIILHDMTGNTYHRCRKDKVVKEILPQLDSMKQICFFNDELIYTLEVTHKGEKVTSNIISWHNNRADTVLSLNKLNAFVFGVFSTHNNLERNTLRTSYGMYNLTPTFYPIQIDKHKTFMAKVRLDDFDVLAYQDGLVFEKNKNKTRKLSGEFITGLGKDQYNNLYASSHTGIHVFTKKTTANKSLAYKTKLIAKDNTTTYLIDQENRIRAEESNTPPVNISTNKKFNQLKRFKNKFFLSKIQDGVYELDIKSGETKLILEDKHPTKEIYLTNDHIFIRDRYNIYTYDYNGHKIDTSGTGSTLFGFLQSGKKLWSYGEGGIFRYQKDTLIRVPLPEKIVPYKTCIIKKDLFFINYTDFKLYKIDDFSSNDTTSIAEIFLKYDLKNLKKISASSFFIRDNNDVNRLISKRNNKYVISKLRTPLSDVSLTNIHSDSTNLYVTIDNSTQVFLIDSIAIKEWHPIVTLQNIVNESNKLLASDNTAFIKYADRQRIYINYQVLGKIGSHVSYQYAINSKNSKDTVWINTTKPQIELLNHNWGTYDILFRAAVNEKTFSNIVTVDLKVQAPFYFRLWFILALIILLILSTFLITSYLRLKKQKRLLTEKEIEKKNLSNEFKALNALMNPHFIFNSLNSIQSLIRKNKDDADNYLVVFSDLVRQNMENVKSELISLEDELTLVTNYLELENLRLNQTLTFKINIEDTLVSSDVKLPPLSIQPLVENSVKHGIIPLQGLEGKIIINISENEDSVEIEVMDNGAGFDKSNNKSGSQSALKNIKKRFEVLSKIHNQKYAVDIIKNAENNEFKNTVLINIPYE